MPTTHDGSDGCSNHPGPSNFIYSLYSLVTTISPFIYYSCIEGVLTFSIIIPSPHRFYKYLLEEVGGGE